MRVCAAENFAAGCRTGSRCLIRRGEATCEAYAQQGESCAELDCNAGLACRDDTCGVGDEEGEACSFFSESCGEGLHCEFFDDICVADAEIGEECSGSTDCVAGSKCESRVGGSQTCHALLLLGEECEAFDCDEGLECGSDSGGIRRCAQKTTPDQCGGFGF